MASQPGQLIIPEGARTGRAFAMRPNISPIWDHATTMNASPVITFCGPITILFSFDFFFFLSAHC